MGAHRSGRRSEVGVGPLNPSGQGRLALGGAEGADELQATKVERTQTEGPESGRVVRVLPDVPAIDREFDYLVPSKWDDGREERLRVGSMVRVPLAGRRVAGWITAIDIEPDPTLKLAELSKLSGVGPDPEMLDLAAWAGWRWAGKRVPFMRAASPPRMVAAVPSERSRNLVPAGPTDVYDEAFNLDVAVVRVPPADDGVAASVAACRRGDALIVTPDASRARRLAIALRRAGITVALAPDDWALAAAGATVVGTRIAAWMPMPSLAAVVVIDEHDEALQEERSPTWHARDVVLERARRRGVPAVMTTPVPSLEALRAGRLMRLPRSTEREQWPIVEVLDRRDDDPARAGPFSEQLTPYLRGDQRVVCVLNRKGRSRLLACTSCGELVRTEDGSRPMVLCGNLLEAPDGSESRPVVCAHCGTTALKNLRVGVERAREELAALVGEEVAEVTAESKEAPSTRVVIGTEAVLHRVDEAGVVVFLDLDQELLAPRQRTVEQSLALIARGARLLGPRALNGRLVVQTRQPGHDVIRAAERGDPSIVAVAERDRRQALGIPPYGAQVAVSGAGGAEFIEAFGKPGEIQIRGPVDGRWLLRAETHQPLLDALAATPRPASRLRLEVDPLRA